LVDGSWRQTIGLLVKLFFPKIQDTHGAKFQGKTLSPSITSLSNEENQNYQNL